MMLWTVENGTVMAALDYKPIRLFRHIVVSLQNKMRRDFDKQSNSLRTI